MYLYLVYVLCCLVLNTLKTFEIADLYGIITAKQLLYRAMPNGSPLTRQPPSDGQLYLPMAGAIILPFEVISYLISFY